MICPKCGSTIDENAAQCPNCQVKFLPRQPSAAVVPGDGGSFWLGVVGFLMPLVGLIIYLVVKDKKPQRARSAGTGALVGACLSIFTLPITAAILFPAFARARENARRASCQSNLQELARANIQYADAHNGKLPDLSSPASIKAALSSYVPLQDRFVCPSDHKPYQGNPALSGQSIDSLSNPAELVLLHDGDASHFDGGNVAYADGHVKWLRPENWAANGK